MKISGANLEHAWVHNRRVTIKAVCLHGELTHVEPVWPTVLTP